MKSISLIIFLFIAASITGCATQVQVTYHSDPPGASLYQGSQLMGYCPTNLSYNITPQDRQRGYLLLQGTEVKWVSGATAKIEQLRANLSTGSYQQFTFMRPTGIEGLETDAKFGLEVQKLRVMEQQVQAQQSANYWQMYNAISNQQKSSSTVNLKTNCSSQVIGSTVYTNCY
ncbi:MAG: hypothetical protein ACWGKN_14150 [Desulfoprunum sp.]